MPIKWPYIGSGPHNLSEVSPYHILTEVIVPPPPIQILTFRRSRYDADGHISSLGHLYITEKQNFRLPSHPAAAALFPRAIPT